jgi:hypothetical protein
MADRTEEAPSVTVALPHVMFPHLIAVSMGAVLFALGLIGVFSPI